MKQIILMLSVRYESERIPLNFCKTILALERVPIHKITHAGERISQRRSGPSAGRSSSIGCRKTVAGTP